MQQVSRKYNSRRMGIHNLAKLKIVKLVETDENRLVYVYQTTSEVMPVIYKHKKLE